MDMVASGRRSSRSSELGSEMGVVRIVHDSALVGRAAKLSLHLNHQMEHVLLQARHTPNPTNTCNTSKAAKNQ